MGLSIGGLLNAAVGGFVDTFTGNPDALISDAQQGASALGFSDAQIQAATGYALSSASSYLDENPTIYSEGPIYGEGGGTSSSWPYGMTTMGAIPMISRIPQAVMAAILKLSQRLGGAGGSPVAYGRRVWATLSGWAAKNPGVSLISLLVSLGLTVEEAAHFLGWGATQKRKRRRRGISAAQLRNARRTLRTIVRMYHSLPHQGHARRVFGGSRTSIVKA